MTGRAKAYCEKKNAEREMAPTNNRKMGKNNKPSRVTTIKKKKKDNVILKLPVCLSVQAKG